MAKVTIGGIEYSAELSRGAGQDRTAVAIYADNKWAGNGYLNESISIVECAADLGDEVYDALDAAIAAELARGIGAEFDPTAR